MKSAKFEDKQQTKEARYFGRLNLLREEIPTKDTVNQ